MIVLASTLGMERHSIQPADAFEAMLPKIREVAAFAFRRHPRGRKEDLVFDAVARAYKAFARLVERGKSDLAYATPLAIYAVKQIRDGRQLGRRRNVLDISSPYSQRRKGFTVQSLHRLESGGWEDVAVEDRRTGPADVAAFRVDFQDWLKQLKRSKRQVALRLAAGDTTAEAARHFKRSAARISQLRQELRVDWDEFHALSEQA